MKKTETEMRTKTKATPVEKTWLSNKEAQMYLGMSQDFFKDLRQDGILSYYKVRNAVFYRKTDIDRLVENGRVY